MRFLVLAASLLLSTSVFAADALTPVKALMDTVVANWSDDEGAGGGDYFDADHLKLFSAGFADLYRQAEKHMEAAGDEEAGGVFDYDPFQGAQDGCPITDLKIGAAKAKGAVSEVDVSFKPFGCFDDDSHDAVAHLTFEVVTEKGTPVIDDVVRADYYGSQPSLRAELKDVLAGN